MSQDAEQLRELIRKYEGRQRDLEERELQARDRLTMLETYMPAVLSWNAWSALQAQQVTPGEVTRIITGQQLLPMDESYTRRLQELENVVRGIKDSEELESVRSSSSLTPDDIENMKKLQEIATNEMALKRRIQSMERKELMYLAALQKADELRMRAEGITSGQEYTSPTIVEAGSSAEGLQRRVVELESEVNRLKKKAEVLEAENEKLLHMISDGTQEGDCQCAGGGLPEARSMPPPAAAAPEAPAEAPAADEPPAGAEEAVAVQELQPAEAAEPVVTEEAAPEEAAPGEAAAEEAAPAEAAAEEAAAEEAAPEAAAPEAAAPEAAAEPEGDDDDVCHCAGDEEPSAPPPEAAEAPAEAPAAEEPPPAEEGAEAAEEPQVVEAAEPVVIESAEPEAAEGGEPEAAEGGEPEAAEGGEPEAAATEGGEAEGGDAAAAEGGEAEAAEGGEAAAAEGGEAEAAEAAPAEEGEAAPAEGGEAEAAEGGEAAPAEEGEAAPAEGGEAAPAEGGEAEAAEPAVTEAAEAPAEAAEEAAAEAEEAPAPGAGGGAPTCACPEPEPEPEPEPPSCKCAAPARAPGAAPPPGAAAPAAAAAAPAGGAAEPPKPDIDAVDYGPRVDHITDCDTEFDEFQAVPEHITKAIAEEEAELYAKAFPPVMPVITRPPRPEIVEEPAAAAAPAAPGEAPAGAAEPGAPAEAGAAPAAAAPGAPAAAGGDALDQLIEMTKALQAAFEHIRGCPSCSSTVGPTLEGIIDTLGRITSSLTAAHGGAPGGPAAFAAPGAAPGAAAPGAGADQDMFPSAPIGEEEECVPFNVTTSDPECGILCWRGSDEFVDSQGEPPQPREYATSDPNCTILCWDDISFEKVKQMPLAVKPPELESKGLEEGQLLTTVDLGAATTQPLSVSADVKVTSGPAVRATFDEEEVTDAPCECDADCTCSTTKIVTLTREPGKEVPAAAADEKVSGVSPGQVKAGEPVALGQQEMMDGCACVGVCTCSTTEIEPVSPEKDVPASTEATVVSPVQVAAESPVVPGAAPPGKAVCSCSGVCTCCMQCLGAAPVATDVTAGFAPAGFAPIGTEAPGVKDKASDESIAESVYTRTSAEEFYFGEAGSFFLEMSKICEFTDSELDLPFEEEVESVHLGSTERLFMNEFPGTGVLPPSGVQPPAVTGAAPIQVTAAQPVALGEGVMGEGCACTGVCRCSTTAMESATRVPVLPGKEVPAAGLSPVQVTAEEPMLLGEDNPECECSGVCSCSMPGIVPIGAQLPTGVSPIGKEIPSLKEKVSDESITESVYTRISAEDFCFGEFGSYVLVEPPKTCEFTDSELDLPFEEDAESVELGPTERLFLDEFPPDRKPVFITGMLPPGAPKVPAPAGEDGFRVERTSSSTGELRDEIYFDTLGRTMEPGTEQMVADVTNMLVEPLETIKKMEDEVMSEIPGILGELLSKCEGGPEGKLELSEVQKVLTDVLAKCAAVDADKQAIMDSVITEVMAKGGGVEAGDVQDILKDLVGKVPGKAEVPRGGPVAEEKEAPDVHAILSDVLTKCGDKAKMEPFDIARIISEVITSQVAIQQEITQKAVCACGKRGIAPEVPPVQKGAEEAIGKPAAPFAFGGPVAAVSASDDSFEYNEDDYSRVTAEDFPFGEIGSCIMEPPKEYSGFTDSELELPFEEEEPIVELGPNERLFQNEFTGEITATPMKREILPEGVAPQMLPEGVAPQILSAGVAPQEQQETEKKRVCACRSSRKSEMAPDRTEEVKVTAEEQEEETFFEAIGETLPQEEVIAETVLSEEIEGDLDSQLASLRQRVAKKSKEIIEIKTLLSQLQQNQSRMEGKLGMEPAAPFPEMAMAAVGPGVRASPSEMQAAIASLQEKCRIKDHMIGAMVEELRNRAQSGIWNELKTRIAAPEMPQPDYTRSQVVEYLTPDGQFPQSSPDSAGACACSGDAKETSMALSLPPPKQERACVAAPPLALQVPIATCTCPGDFKIVRKIGADSLLVGWQVPTTSANLAGYDIYVNGVLQCKVWSGTRNRALLHCLDLSSPMVILLYGRTVSGQLSGPARITYPGGS